MSDHKDADSSLDNDGSDHAPRALSDWLRDQDIADLASFARAARLAGHSFARRLLDRE